MRSEVKSALGGKKRTLSNEINKLIGKTVTMAGWVNKRRDHGKLVFIDLRDRTGLTQVVFIPGSNAHKIAHELRSEFVIQITGRVNKRPKGMENNKIPSGLVELEGLELEILNKAITTPFEIDKDTANIDEEIRMKYRYLDIRSERMKNNLIMRHKVVKFFRDFLDKEDFIEIETPMLTKSTPEGSRDFIVPSRLEPGKFYALPQSPQQYKQLLQVAGTEKYFQIARCLRDEDPRGDRQTEHTQLDMEMSFVEQEDVMSLVERLLITLIKDIYPKKEIQTIPFPRLTYKEATDKYKSDKPDLRKDKNNPNLLAFCWIIDFPFFKKDEEGKWTFTHNPFSAPQQEFMTDLMAKNNIENILTAQYDIVLNGFEVGGGSIRNHLPEALKKVFEIMGYSEERIQENFGHMLKAFEFGAPPHGGIAPGIDRIMMILQNEPNIREVIAFPKTGDGRDLMMGAPSEIDPRQVKEAHIEIKTKISAVSNKHYKKN